MKTKWTKEQQQVIESRDCNLLVSAAAGSGKTAVLVERMIQRLLDEKQPVDIDRLLVVTFTKAAAAEMRERVSVAIEEAMEKDPTNDRLRRQHALIHNALITTIDSFCLFVVRNYFQCIHLEPGFRIGDQNELSLIAEEVLDQVMESHYKKSDAAFVDFMEAYEGAKGDKLVRGMVKQLYEYADSEPWPKRWLLSLTDAYEDTGEYPWLEAILNHAKHLILDGSRNLKQAYGICLEPDGPYMYTERIQSEITMLEAVQQAKDYHTLQQVVSQMQFENLPTKRGFEGDADKKKQVQDIRDNVKKQVKKITEQFLKEDFAVVKEDLSHVHGYVRTLVDLTIAYSDAFQKRKEEKHLLSFADVEHRALQILVDENTGEPTDVAKDFAAYFEEIMIDEYQDSNHLQEAILTSFARTSEQTGNLFMVGDVKQSIYRFRLARPELFMEKYRRYTLEPSVNHKICLDKNFRSRRQVLDSVNRIFEQIMHEDFGAVEYDDLAALHPQASYPEVADTSFQTQILLTDISMGQREEADLDKTELEAYAVAEKMKQLMESDTMQVTDKETGLPRNLRYSDMVILLRSPGSDGEVYRNVLQDAGIPAYIATENGYFQTTEIQVLLSLLNVIDNPLQDIPLTAVLLSPIGGFTPEELAIVKTSHTDEATDGAKKNTTEDVEKDKTVLFFYEYLVRYLSSGEKEELKEKIRRFLEQLEAFRSCMSDFSICELLQKILDDTGYFAYVQAMPSGAKRGGNVKMLIDKAKAYENSSYKGLFHFIQYIEKLQKYEVDFGEADLISENEDVVRVMSIHKSKGLEFPVVFVCGIGKRFNLRDTSAAMVLDVDYGVGLHCVYKERRIKRPTLYRRAISLKMEEDSIAEEMRVLYVALTRAKELLILTGGMTDLEKSLAKYELQGKHPTTYSDRREAKCYMDWILPVAIHNPALFAIETVSRDEQDAVDAMDAADTMISRSEFLLNMSEVDESIVQTIEEQFHRTYHYDLSMQAETKLSVSELKHRNMKFSEEDTEYLAWYAKEENEDSLEIVPAFMREELGIEEKERVSAGALRGTAIHRFMECVDYEPFTYPVDETQLQLQIEQLRSSGKMTDEQIEKLNTDKLLHFFNSALGVKIYEAAKQKTLYREQPFVMGIPAKELQPELSDDREELTLIQGIIDLYLIEDDEIVLVDYKTDAVKRIVQLEERYRTQMELYAKALTKATGKNVKEMILYSFSLDEPLFL